MVEKQFYEFVFHFKNDGEKSVIGRCMTGNFDFANIRISIDSFSRKMVTD